MDDNRKKVNNLIKGKITIKNRETGEIIDEYKIGPESDIWFKVEDKPDNSYRTRLDRYKDGIVHKQIIEDMEKIGQQIMKLNPDGMDFYCFTLPPKPMPIQKGDYKKTDERRNYKKNLDYALSKNESELTRFNNKKLFVYLCFYLRKRKYEKSDLDNYEELIIDALKPFIGDDCQITRKYSAKKQLYEDYNKSDLDFLENTLVIIIEDKHESILLRALSQVENI